VLLSVLVYPPPELCRPALLTAWAAVSVCRVVELYSSAVPVIKWPNDILLEGRKVCGILIETARQNQRLAAVVGIGLNVTQTEEDFRSAGLPNATSLACHIIATPEAHRVARELTELLDEEYHLLGLSGREGLESRWRESIGLLDQPVVAECRDAEHAGRLIELTLDRIVLWRDDGPPAVLAPESVLHLRQR
jgi:BirA family biotin operon repressor/biotin-[acetyl-CoA-carboxylase] ligase